MMADDLAAASNRTMACSAVDQVVTDSFAAIPRWL
jgi:hypothetical protein